MLDRLSSLAVKKGDYWYLVGGFEPNAKVGKNADMPIGLIAEEWDGRLIQVLSQYYKATGYEPAREMAGKLANYFRYHTHYYDEQGRFLWTESDQQFLGWGLSAKGQVFGGNGHGHTIGLLAMLEYGTAASDRDTLQFVKSSFEWAKRQDGGFGVSPLVGWFPEWYLPSTRAAKAASQRTWSPWV
jgi:hypothetical protein